ncbi:DNA-binding protein [Paraburkholderia sp. MM5384-R2]|uniref:DNA-binding protein n=1 Tax=unclassified Paraburkholderia TaxID=2615204 RepID=UPI00160EBB6E|nr:DNA-binding protein [Paraburkholderia sp. MM5384-R2]MBB5501649.1 hypothetical protein [Paraburkholderia sp. MM5384-R2]
MARPAAVTPDAIRATILAMLAEAGDPTLASDAPFPEDRLVAQASGHVSAPAPPATLSRHLNAIEAEVVHAGLTGFALPDVPPEIAAQMPVSWEAAVATQLDSTVRLCREAEALVGAAAEAQHNAALKVELLRVEFADVRSQLSARDAALAVAVRILNGPRSGLRPLKILQAQLEAGAANSA